MLDLIITFLISHCTYAYVRINHMNYIPHLMLFLTLSLCLIRPLFPCMSALSDPCVLHSGISRIAFCGQRGHFCLVYNRSFFWEICVEALRLRMRQLRDSGPWNVLVCVATIDFQHGYSLNRGLSCSSHVIGPVCWLTLHDERPGVVLTICILRTSSLPLRHRYLLVIELRSCELGCYFIWEFDVPSAIFEQWHVRCLSFSASTHIPTFPILHLTPGQENRTSFLVQ